MKHLKEFLIIVVYMMILTLKGCSPGPEKLAIKTDDPVKGTAAVEQLDDQTVLAKVALEALNIDVCLAAVEKLSEQPLLADVSLLAMDYQVREAAVRKLHDQAVIARIALGDKHWSVRKAAVEALNDPLLLTKIALEEEPSSVRYAAVEKLEDPVVLAKVVLDDQSQVVRQLANKKLGQPSMMKGLAEVTDDKRIQSLCTFLHSFNEVPSDHRSRLINAMLSSFLVLVDHDVAAITGEIVSVRVRWSPRRASYTGVIPGTKQGESFSCSIRLKNLVNPLSHTWESEFPYEATNLHFEAAKINTGKLVEPAFDKLPESILIKIAVDKSFGVQERECAVKKLTDQNTLVDLASDEKDYWVSRAAKTRLDDLRKPGG